MEWDDIDFSRQVIHIKRASQWQRGSGVVAVPTKNMSSVRTIKLPSFIFQILTDYKNWCLEQNPSCFDGQTVRGRLFTQAGGNPIYPDTVNYWLRKFIKKYNLPHFTPHSLRHTFATLQIMAGVNIRTVQARTGHAQASTLVNIYSHAIKTADEMATEALDSILTPKDYGTAKQPHK